MVKKKKKSMFKGKVASNVQKQKARKNSFGYLKLPKGIEMYKEEPGSRARIDILPYLVKNENHMDRDDEAEIARPGDPWFKLPFKVHRNIGASQNNVVCPTTFGKKCPICEYRSKLLKNGESKDEADAIRPSMRNLYLVRIAGKKSDEQTRIWDISQYLFQNLLNEEIDEDEDFERFPELSDGLTLKIRFDEKSFAGNKFAEASRIDFVERAEQYPEDLIDELPCLDEVLAVKSYEELERMFFEDMPETGNEDEEDDVEEEEEEEEADTFEDEDDDAEEEEEEEEEEPEEPGVEKGDFIEWEYRDKMLQGEVTSVTEKGIRAKRTDNNKITLVPLGKFGIIDAPDEPGEEAEEEEEEAPAPSKAPTRKKKTVKSTKKNKCPYGHTFGVDTEEYEDCDECELWEACLDKKEEE